MSKNEKPDPVVKEVSMEELATATMGRAQIGFYWKIDDDYHVSVDSRRLNYHLYRRQPDKKGEKMVNHFLGFFGCLSHVVNAYCKHRVISSDCQSVSEIAELLGKIEAHVQKIAKNKINAVDTLVERKDWQ